MGVIPWLLPRIQAKSGYYSTSTAVKEMIDKILRDSMILCADYFICGCRC